MCNKIKEMLQQSCRAITARTYFILLCMKPELQKIKQNIYFIAAFILFYCACLDKNSSNKISCKQTRSRVEPER